MLRSVSARHFISEADGSTGYGKHIPKSQYEFAPKIITVDPAWEGDDEFVIAMRQGLVFKILETFPKNDNDLIAAQKIARYEDEHKADAVFIDAGFGTGIKSAGQGLGREWKLVWFAGKSNDPGCFNKRAEMWKAARDWLKDGGVIPDDPMLRDELQSPEIVPRADGKIQIESKKEMKSRGVPSPNRADALVISFAYPVVKKEMAYRGDASKMRHDYSPI